jgi:alcohol-forming fatty acyl-CoA reductase
MRGYPNTYALSKIMAEDLVHSYRDKFAIVIARPSIVISAWQEPFPGYVESKKNGLTAILLSRGRGVMRTIFSNPKNLLEVIPVDIANNAILTLTVKRALLGGNEVLYTNLTNSNLQSWTLKQYFDYEMEVALEYPLDLLIWWPYCPLTTNRLYYEFRRLMYHYIPALMGDISCYMAGRKPL